MNAQSQDAPAARPRDVRTRLLGGLRVLIAALPQPVGNFLADLLGTIIYYTAGKSRRASISNLRHVLGPVPRSVLRGTVKRVFRNIMRAYYDLCRAPSQHDDEIDRLVDFDYEGWSRVEALHANGRGIILATGHFGGFDEMTHVITLRGIPMSVLISRVKPAWLSDFVTVMRAARGLNMLLVDEEEGTHTNLGALRESIKALRRGDLLGLVADRNTELQGVTVNFFGYKTVVAPGVAKIALRTKSPVVVSFCRRLQNNKYVITFNEPIEPEGSASNPEDVQRMLQKIFSLFEKSIRRNPDQWLLLQPVWPRARTRKASSGQPNALAAPSS